VQRSAAWHMLTASVVEVCRIRVEHELIPERVPERRRRRERMSQGQRRRGVRAGVNGDEGRNGSQGDAPTHAAVRWYASGAPWASRRRRWGCAQQPAASEVCTSIPIIATQPEDVVG
jgi:hypothetical protein